MSFIAGAGTTNIDLLYTGVKRILDVPSELELRTHEGGAFRRGKASESIIQNFLDLVVVFLLF